MEAVKEAIVRVAGRQVRPNPHPDLGEGIKRMKNAQT